MCIFDNYSHEYKTRRILDLDKTLLKESSVLPVIRKYSDPNATNYSNAQLLYDDLVSHFMKGLSGCQHLEIIEHEIDDLKLDSN